jgi:hypothetical protein
MISCLLLPVRLFNKRPRTVGTATHLLDCISFAFFYELVPNFEGTHIGVLLDSLFYRNFGRGSIDFDMQPSGGFGEEVRAVGGAEIEGEGLGDVDTTLQDHLAGDSPYLLCLEGPRKETEEQEQDTGSYKEGNKRVQTGNNGRNCVHLCSFSGSKLPEWLRSIIAVLPCRCQTSSQDLTEI